MDRVLLQLMWVPEAAGHMLCAGCRPSPSKTSLLLTSALRREMVASAHLTEKKLKAPGKVPAHCPGAARVSRLLPTRPREETPDSCDRAQTSWWGRLLPPP